MQFLRQIEVQIRIVEFELSLTQVLIEFFSWLLHCFFLFLDHSYYYYYYYYYYSTQEIFMLAWPTGTRVVYGTYSRYTMLPVLYVLLK